MTRHPLPAELAHHLDELRPNLRARLALGPIGPDPVNTGDVEQDTCDDWYGCRVCATLILPATTWLEHGAPTSTGHRQGAAALALQDWHQAVIGDSAAYEPRLTSGVPAYARCLAIYQAAGWTGPCPGPAALRCMARDGGPSSPDDPTPAVMVMRLGLPVAYVEPGPRERCGDPMLDAARHWPHVPADVQNLIRS